MQPFNAPSITLDEARLSSGEVFINGQHDPANRPKPIARAYVDVTPAAAAARWTSSRPSTRAPPGSPFTKWHGQQRLHLPQREAGPSTPAAARITSPSGRCWGSSMLGFADGGSSCNVSITPKNVPTKLAVDRYLHVRMIVGHPVDRPPLPADHGDERAAGAGSRADAGNIDVVPVHTRLGTFPFDVVGPDDVAGTADDVPPMGGRTIVVAAVRRLPGDADRVLRHARLGREPAVRPRQRLRLPRAATTQDTWKQPWTAVPVQGDVAGFDRPGAVGRLHVDRAACTCSWTASRRRAPCCRAGACRPAPVTVAYRAVALPLRHRRDGHARRHRATQYEHDYSICHSDRHMDDFGIELARRRPPGTRRVLPCGTRWYGGA